MTPSGRLWAAAIAVMVLQIGVTFLIALYSRPSPVNILYWSVVPAVVAGLTFSDTKSWLIRFGPLWLLFVPAAIVAELLAHFAGTCLQ